MKIRIASAALLLTAGLALSACGDEYEYRTTDTVGDCDAGDWATRDTDPESMRECAGKTGPDPDSDKPHKVKKPKTTKPKTGNTKKDTKPKVGNTKKDTKPKVGKK